MVFQYPLFRIELLSSSGALQAPIIVLFQYPLFRIELLSKVRGDIQRMADSFNIRSFGSNCSAWRAFLFMPSFSKFQYPLFRIELLSDSRQPGGT